MRFFKTSHFFRSPLVSRHHIWILYHLFRNIKWTNYNTHFLISIWLLLIILSIVLFRSQTSLFRRHIQVVTSQIWSPWRHVNLFYRRYACLDVISAENTSQIWPSWRLIDMFCDILVLTSCPPCSITDVFIMTLFWLVMSQSYLSWRHVVPSHIWPS